MPGGRRNQSVAVEWLAVAIPDEQDRHTPAVTCRGSPEGEWVFPRVAATPRPHAHGPTAAGPATPRGILMHRSPDNAFASHSAGITLYWVASACGSSRSALAQYAAIWSRHFSRALLPSRKSRYQSIVSESASERSSAGGHPNCCAAFDQSSWSSCAS